jgi:hypothetical protein
MILVIVIKIDILDECGKKIKKGKRDTWVQKLKNKKKKVLHYFFNVKIVFVCLLLFIFIHSHFSLIFHDNNNIQTIHSSFLLVLHLKSASLLFTNRSNSS